MPLVSTRGKLTSGFGLAILTLIGLLVFTKRITSKHSETSAWVSHTYEAIALLDGAATEEYAVLGRPAVAGDCEQHQTALLKKVALFKQLTIDNPRQQARVRQLDDVLKTHASCSAAAQDQAESVINLLAQIRHEEEMLLQDRSMRDREGEANELLAMNVVTGIGIAISALAAAFVAFDLRRRQMTEIELRESRITLQERVQERTAELASALERLQAEAAERSQAQTALRESNLALGQRVSQRTQALTALYERAENANRAKSQFLASMSHDLRTPLNGIIGCAELVKDGMMGPVNAGQVECLQDVLISGIHLRDLINDLLDLAKIEGRKLPVDPVSIQVSAVVQEVADVVRVVAQQNEIDIAVELSPDVNWVFTDARKVKQIAHNLASNALKFTKSGGSITMRVEPEEPDCFRIEVEDTGIGIAAEKLAHIWDHYGHASNEMRGASGTGLGLALVKQFTELLGGRVSARSELGNGSLFSVTLPRVFPIPAGDEAHQTDSTQPHLILVIEDDSGERQWMADTLRGAGFCVEVAATPDQAFSKYAHTKFGVITLDWLLDGTPGLDVLRRIRRTGKNRTTPVIVTSVEESVVTQDLPISGHLMKPISKPGLLNLLERAGIEKECPVC